MPNERKQTVPPLTDVKLDEGESTSLRGEPTGAAPSLPQPLAQRELHREVVKTVPYTGSKRGVVGAMTEGERIDDFEIEAVLGRGAFGVVYLARQLSLDRQVALKVAANQGSEGRTMARLEHKHIVQVFSETVDSSGQQKLLCMQLVPGAPLDAVVHDLAAARHLKGAWAGADVLASVDRRSKLSDVFDSGALHDREALAEMDDLEATCWIGGRLAEAVDYAHRQGVLHRDIKPANVLVNRYGQPLLADFNISFQEFDETTSVEDRLGGTLAYMSPEHLDAFNPTTDVPAEAVDARSDVYSIGIVLAELLEGSSPLESPPRSGNRMQYLTQLAAVRRVTAPSAKPGPGDARKAFDYIVANCLDPDPDQRFQSSVELARSLDGCRELRAHEHISRSRGGSRLVQWVRKSPILFIVLFALLPQIAGSIFNVSYNQLEIVGRLSETQQSVFWWIVLFYNVLVYPAALVAIAALVLPLNTVWNELCDTQRVPEQRLEWARRRALVFPIWLLVIAAAGWLPGGLFFPGIIDATVGDVSLGLYLHFIASFTISGLIAVAYSLCGLQFVVLHGLYTRMWPRAEAFRATARRQLPPTRWRLWLMLVLAGLIPLLAAIMLIFTATNANDLPFKLLTVSFMLVGMVGAAAMVFAALRMNRLIDIAIGGDRRQASDDSLSKHPLSARH